MYVAVGGVGAMVLTNRNVFECDDYILVYRTK